MKYIIYLDVAAIVILITIAINFLFNKQVKNQRYNMLYALVYVVFFGAVIDIITSVVDGNPNVPTFVLYLLCIVYLGCVSTVPLGYFNYVYMVCHRNKPVSKKQYLGFAVPFFVVILLLLSTPVTKLIFYYDASNVYYHGVLYNAVYGVAIFYALAGIVYSIKYRKRLNNWMRFALLIYPVAMFGVIGFQMITPYLMMMQFAETICVQLLVFSIDNPAVYRDDEVDCFNGKAFIESFKYEIAKERHFKVLAVRVGGFVQIHELMGMSAGEQTARSVAGFLRTIVKDEQFFRIEMDIFALILKDQNELKRVQQAIYERSKSPFEIQKVFVKLKPIVSVMSCPEDVSSVEGVMEMISCSLREAEDMGLERAFHPGQDILIKGRRETKLLRVLKEAIENKEFNVYYQPVYSTIDGRFVRAEALVRLFDDDIGFISPSEFVPLAEKNGLIAEIDEIVFNNVCRFIKQERLWERGIEKIDINLSAVQCMQENLADILGDAIEAYGIPDKMFDFEITEETAANSEDKLKLNMEELMKKGVSFSVDNYGEGYSNTSTIVDFPFNLVKIDKSLLWKATKNPRAMVALKNTVNMMNEMGLETVISGIESKEMAELMDSLGCHLQQGFYYSRPIPPEQFLAYLDI